MTHEDNFTDDELRASLAAQIPRHRPVRPKTPWGPSAYAITLVPQRGSIRTKLLMTTRKAAFQFLRKWGPSLYECLFTFVVVERIPLNFIPNSFHTEEAYWYVWSYSRQDLTEEEYEAMTAVERIRFMSEGRYSPIQTPAFYKDRELLASIG